MNLADAYLQLCSADILEQNPYHNTIVNCENDYLYACIVFDGQQQTERRLASPDVCASCQLDDLSFQRVTDRKSTERLKSV